MSDLHDAFDAWLIRGARDDLPRAVALHASACPGCLQAAGGLRCPGDDRSRSGRAPAARGSPRCRMAVAVASCPRRRGDRRPPGHRRRNRRRRNAPAPAGRARGRRRDADARRGRARWPGRSAGIRNRERDAPAPLRPPRRPTSRRAVDRSAAPRCRIRRWAAVRRSRRRRPRRSRRGRPQRPARGPRPPPPPAPTPSTPTPHRPTPAAQLRTTRTPRRLPDARDAARR